MNRFFPFLLLGLIAVSLTSQAQSPVKANPVTGVPLPWGLSNLSVVDGRLYACQGGVLVNASSINGTIVALNPDTLITPLCPQANYVVRNNRDSLYYFTTPADSKTSSFHVHTQSRFFKNRKVEISSWFRDICQPAFSPDGNTMVFSSKGKVGLGGYDLWCSFWNGKRWTKPINLGNIINTQGNEMYPAFYGNFLVYSSNGVANAPEGYHLYAVRMKPGSKADDVIFANYVVQPLPQPLNSQGDDWEMVFDSQSGKGYWLSSRNGKEELFTFSGSLDGITLSGIVTNDMGDPIPGATVQLLTKGRLTASALSDSSGKYQLFALPGDEYKLIVSKPDFFRFEKNLPLIRPNEDMLIASQNCDVVLSGLAFNRSMMFDALYKESSDIELDSQAKESLQPIVDYLRDNPTTLVQITLNSPQTNDESYNNLIIEHRISILRNYFESCLPTGCRISFKKGLSDTLFPESEEARNVVFVKLLK